MVSRGRNKVDRGRNKVGRGRNKVGRGRKGQVEVENDQVGPGRGRKLPLSPSLSCEYFSKSMSKHVRNWVTGIPITSSARDIYFRTPSGNQTKL